MSNTDDTDEFYLEIFVSHGKGPLFEEVEKFIELQMQHEVAALPASADASRSDLAALDSITDECSFAIVILTADDGRSRENVSHEIGFCQGKFGCENVLVLKQEGCAEFSGISGILYQAFSGTDIKSTFGRIEKEIEAAIIRFESDEEDDDDED